MFKETRLNQNITQKELAQRLGVKQNTISMWETGKAQPRLNMIPRLAEVLGVSPLDILMCFDEESEHDVKCN